MNELKHIDEFREILKNYTLSDSAKQTLANTQLVLLVGPTSSGRNTIINELLKSGPYHYVVSDTTRQKRVKDGVEIEEDGREYWFRAEEDVLADLAKGEFLEAAVIHGQQVSGISIREIEKAHQAHQIATTDIEPTGAASIHALKPDVQIIFIVPPNFSTWLSRFLRRSDLPDSEIRRRLQAAYEEITIALERDYYQFVLNDDFVEAAKAIQAIVQEHTTDAVAEAHARQVAQQLLTDIHAHLLEQPANSEI